jgi:hypothetical protein
VKLEALVWHGQGKIRLEDRCVQQFDLRERVIGEPGERV